MFKILTLTKTTENTIILTKRLALRLNKGLYMWYKLKKRHYENLTARTTLLVLLSAVLVSCGPLMQKPVQNKNNLKNLDAISYWILTEERVPYYNTLYFNGGQGYEFRNASSNKLIITLDGGGDWTGARVGEIGEKLEWNQIVNWLLSLYGEYNIFVPEKFDWVRGSNPFWDIKNRERYTFDNLIENYAVVIKEYLSQNDYETIIIAGHSEGGLIAPELYFQLEGFNISALISSGAGGLIHPIDIDDARRQRPLDEESLKRYRDAYNRYLTVYSGERYAEAPDEIEFRQTGRVFIPIMYSYSQIARRPFEFYKNIDIPVLFIHGLLDIFVPPISTGYVEENLPDKPFDYIYYADSQHYPTTVRELERMRTDIANWLKEKGL
jgi:pimeloyl-ACP methyl ester carboxylesterase